MKTHVYTQYVGGSGLDARYIGTVKESPKIVAEQLRAVKGISHVEIFALINGRDHRTVNNEVVAFGPRPF